MKPKSKTQLKADVSAKTDALVADLNAIRTQVLNRQGQTNPTEQASLDRRLFEVWVIDKLAQAECQVSGFAAELEAVWQELEQTQDELKALQKSLPRVLPKAAKKSR